MARTCEECGGTRDGADGRLVVRGCPGCCRDCGFPCDHDKDDEGFHVVAIDEEYLEARRLAEAVDHERLVTLPSTKSEAGS
jgi:hypothetical protein